MKIIDKKDIALFRYGVIAPLLTNPNDYESNSSFYNEQSKIKRTYVTGEEITVSADTIERWYYFYKKGGFDALLPKRRQDLGRTRKLDNDIANIIQEYIQKYSRLNAKNIYQTLIDEGKIKRNEVSYSTVNRLYKKIKEKPIESKKEMLRYECEYANDVWCADSSFGLRLYKDNKSIRLVIIAFIDDASRLITSCKIYDSDNIFNLLDTYKDAIERYGVPKKLNLDNGSNYRSTSFSIVNAKLCVGMHYNPIHTPTSKAKIERFFRTLKEQWMNKINFHDFHSIEEFQVSLDKYINTYNNNVHSSLNGFTPNDRYIRDVNIIRYLSLEEINNCFLLELKRKASFDALIQINDVEYQLPNKFSNRKVTIVYLYDFSKVYVVDEDKYIEIFKVDKLANSKIQRAQYKLSSEGNL